MTTELQTEPVLEGPPAQWPPVQHIVHDRQKPVREGTIALCGARLMGLELGRLRDATGDLCPKCEAEFKRLAESGEWE